jgi:type VI secretion system protein ImpB
VNIVYKPATGNAQEEVELPLKILMMGDYTQRQDDRPVEDRKPINVDKDNFSQVLAEQKLELDLQVPDKLSNEPGAELSRQPEVQEALGLHPRGHRQPGAGDAQAA